MKMNFVNYIRAEKIWQFNLCRKNEWFSVSKSMCREKSKFQMVPIASRISAMCTIYFGFRVSAQQYNARTKNTLSATRWNTSKELLACSFVLNCDWSVNITHIVNMSSKYIKYGAWHCLYRDALSHTKTSPFLYVCILYGLCSLSLLLLL